MTNLVVGSSVLSELNQSVWGHSDEVSSGIEILGTLNNLQNNINIYFYNIYTYTYNCNYS